MNATVTSTLRVYDDRDGKRPLIETTDRAEIAEILAREGVRFEGWDASVPVSIESTQDEILAAYADDVERIKREGGYTTVDVLRLKRGTPDTEPVRKKFLSEHTHTEDEVRFFVEGAAAFYLRLGGRVYQTVCVRGDLISVPAGTKHWFDMGPSPEFCAIRFFQNTEGWTPHYTGDEIAATFPLYE